MALYGKCNKCGTYFYDMFGEFYDEETQELVCPMCDSRDIDDCEGNEDVDFLSLFNYDKKGIGKGI